MMGWKSTKKDMYEWGPPKLVFKVTIKCAFVCVVLLGPPVLVEVMGECNRVTA